jgi:hypothetical protein
MGGCTPKLFLVRVISKVVKNTVKDVKFAYFMMARLLSVLWNGPKAFRYCQKIQGKNKVKRALTP